MTEAAPNGALVQVEHLSEFFPLRGGLLQRKVGDVKAVDDVSFEIRRGETLGLVGESGCGKTTVGGPPAAHRADRRPDRVRRDDITHLKGSDLKRYRRRMQIVFQDPYASLDPRSPIATAIGEARHPRHRDAQERADKVASMMDLVGLQPYHARRYPHEFSGGQRQRIGIARARPRAGPARLRRAGQRARRQHPGPGPEPAPRPPAPAGPDLPVHRPQHGRRRAHQRPGRGHVPGPWSRSPAEGDLPPPGPPVHHRPAVRGPGGKPSERTARRRIILRGDVPSPVNPPSGCRFHTRCWLRTQLGNPERCATERPELRTVATTTRSRATTPRSCSSRPTASGGSPPPPPAAPAWPRPKSADDAAGPDRDPGRLGFATWRSASRWPRSRPTWGRGGNLELAARADREAAAEAPTRRLSRARADRLPPQRPRPRGRHGGHRPRLASSRRPSDVHRDRLRGGDR